MKINSILSILLITMLYACKDTENANNENEHEAITTLELQFSKNGIPSDTFYYDDPDGDGGNAPIKIDTLVLDTQTTYTLKIRLLNKTKNPVSDVTPTIAEQGTAHELFMIPTSGVVNIIRTDKDAAGFPLGLSSIWVTGNISSVSSVRFKLMHKPVIKGPNDTPDKGHSDIDVTLPLILR
jgi:hypothetical protein